VAAEVDALVRAHVCAVKVVGGVPVYRFNREAEKLAWAEAAGDARVRAARRAVGEELLSRGDAVAAAALLLEVDPKGLGAKAAVEGAALLASRGALEDAVDLYTRALPQL